MVQQLNPHPGEIVTDPACGTGGFLTCAMRHMRDRYIKRPEDEVLMQASLRDRHQFCWNTPNKLPGFSALTHMIWKVQFITLCVTVCITPIGCGVPKAP
ncbi:N-6 DNA methylase [Pseudorhodobacter sp. W20_MBD10_FR17]|uniref:N-6 DNA methylase n=1 Tax=Pseudorhodobacter sp. W20_MBD10_FR17 TaxID=3240266 RepID=UPI003F98CA31